LQAAGISTDADPAPGCDLAIVRADGSVLNIRLGLREAEPRPEDCLFILAADMRADPLKNFHIITEAAQRGRPVPVDRGPEPEAQRLHFSRDFELVAMRHREFRKVPNPTPEILMAFKPVIEKAISRFMYINRKICQRHGLQACDLRTYAQVWTCNYLGLYWVKDPVDRDNERKLYAHLCQRFANFIEILLAKERSCVPDAETASVALYGGPAPVHLTQYQHLSAQAQATMVDPDVDMAEERGEGDLDNLAALGLYAAPLEAYEDAPGVRKAKENTRRLQARKLLRKALASLPHDQLLFKLGEAMDNEFLCPDARDAAKRYLKKHRRGCSSCSVGEAQQ
jgi:hypothetical protein